MEVIYHTKSIWIDIGSGPVVCQTIYDFVSLYTNKVSYTSGDTKLKFNDRFYHNLPNGLYNQSASSKAIAYLIREDGTTADLGNFGYWAYNNSAVLMKLKIVGPVFILQIVREAYPSECTMGLFWINNGDMEFFTKVSTDAMSIDVGTYHDARTVEPTIYSLKTLMPFGMTFQKIAYTSYSYIYNSDNVLIPLNDIYSCSTITRDSLITISGQNYYAIGANFLIQVDTN